MEILIGLIALIIATVIMVEIGARTGLPWPALLVIIAGIGIFIPGVPEIDIPADLMLPIFIPPLLWALARRTSWQAIHSQWKTILSMSIGLTLVTALVVGFSASLLIPGLGFASALVIGAAISPPDPVAVEAVAEPAGVPRRLSSTLQTEGLFNDAASIVVFNLALSVVTTGNAVEADSAIYTFIYAAGVAGILGYLIGRGAAWLNNHLSNVAARTAFSWAIPFATYIVAEEIHASGVIAIVIAAIEFHNRSSSGAEDRLTGATFWEIIELLFTGVAFGLIGLMVRDAIDEVGSDIWHAVLIGTILSFVAILVRAIWMYAAFRWNMRSARCNNHIPQGAPLRLQEVLLLTWAGMRGLVTLALVLSIPYSSGFEAYNELPVIALTVLLWTMVISGLTLPWLMSNLSLDKGPDVFGDEAREELLQRARAAARDCFTDNAHWIPEDKRSEVLHTLEERTGLLASDGDNSALRSKEKIQEVTHKITAARLNALEAAQASMLEARNEPGVEPAIVDEILHNIDAQILGLQRQKH
ncbi:MAG: sodium:proton antiporter [Corynebacterium sp.]|nr:sodium:proton antiporter [Corynebacterium sp.]